MSMPAALWSKTRENDACRVSSPRRCRSRRRRETTAPAETERTLRAAGPGSSPSTRPPILAGAHRFQRPRPPRLRPAPAGAAAGTRPAAAGGPRSGVSASRFSAPPARTGEPRSPPVPLRSAGDRSVSRRGERVRHHLRGSKALEGKARSGCGRARLFGRWRGAAGAVVLDTALTLVAAGAVEAPELGAVRAAGRRRNAVVAGSIPATRERRAGAGRSLRPRGQDRQLLVPTAQSRCPDQWSPRPSTYTLTEPNADGGTPLPRPQVDRAPTTATGPSCCATGALPRRDPRSTPPPWALNTRSGAMVRLRAWCSERRLGGHPRPEDGHRHDEAAGRLPDVQYTFGRTGIAAPAQLDDPKTCQTNMIGTGPFRK